MISRQCRALPCRSDDCDTHPLHEDEFGQAAVGILDAGERVHDFAIVELVFEFVESSIACSVEREEREFSLSSLAAAVTEPRVTDRSPRISVRSRSPS